MSKKQKPANAFIDDLAGVVEKERKARAIAEKSLAYEMEQSDIKREVIIHQRACIKSLLENQERLLQASLQESSTLASALGALAVYREEILRRTSASLKDIADSGHSCVPGCTKHKWDDGWVRVKP